MGIHFHHLLIWEHGIASEQVPLSNPTNPIAGNPDCLNLEPALKWETLSERIRKLKKNASPTPGTHNPQTASPLAGERSDAITQSPVDIVQEEQSRRVETSKWLDNHFGSESSASSSKNSTGERPFWFDRGNRSNGGLIVPKIEERTG